MTKRWCYINLRKWIFKFVYSFCFALFLLTISCNAKKNKHEKFINLNPVDSFYIYNYIDISEMLSFNFLSDSVLMSCDQATNSLIEYHKINKTNIYEQMKQTTLNLSSNIVSFDIINTGVYMIGTINNDWYIKYDKRPPIKLNLSDCKKYLKDNFVLSSLKYHPMIHTDDGRFIFTVYYNNLNEYNKYFLEPLLSEYKIENDTLTYSSSYIEKPTELIYYRHPWGRYTYNSKTNDILVIFPPFDTLFTINLNSKARNSIPINNCFYSKPIKYVIDSFFTKSGIEYDYEYSLENFEYVALYRNNKTNHLLFLFNSPLLKDTNGEKKLLGLITDINFKHIGYVDFSNRSFFNPENFIQLPSGDLGFPIYNKNKSIKRENIKILVYTF